MLADSILGFGVSLRKFSFKFNVFHFGGLKTSSSTYFTGYGLGPYRFPVWGFVNWGLRFRV